MKYDQQSRKVYLENQLKIVLNFIGMDESLMPTVTYKDIRVKLLEIYPPLVSAGSSVSYPADEALIRDRRKVLNISRHLLYELNTIRSRESNAS